jgi:dTDP-L-rhamnose 4-epimerase
MASPSAYELRRLGVGTGQGVSIVAVARRLARACNRPIEPEITHLFRKGDIRHCVADISKIARLGFEPQVSFADGVGELVEWWREAQAVDRFDEHLTDLRCRGLA